MTLEETGTIDFISPDDDGRLALVITDSGTTIKAKERERLLQEKLLTYSAYIDRGLYCDKHPEYSRASVYIKVVCAQRPTVKMLRCRSVAGDQGEIPVVFELFLPGKGRPEAIAPGSPAAPGLYLVLLLLLLLAAAAVWLR